MNKWYKRQSITTHCIVALLAYLLVLRSYGTYLSCFITSVPPGIGLPRYWSACTTSHTLYCYI